jgi:nicotinamidase-related amidase
MQKAFMPYMCEQDRRLVPDGVNGAIGLFRTRGLPVIKVCHTDPAWGVVPGAAVFPFVDGIQMLDEDPVVVKRHPSAFKGTGLAERLGTLGADTLFLAGLSGTGCVLATYRAADDLDYRVFMVRDAVLSPKAHHTEAVLDFCHAVDAAALELLLDSLD